MTTLFSTGQEIDFILEGPNSNIVAVEVKAASRATDKDFRHIIALRDALGAQFHCGFVVYQGHDIVPFGKDLFAIPMQSLWQR